MEVLVIEDMWTVAQIAEHRGWTVGSARVWVADQVKAGRLRAETRDLVTGAKLYPKADVQAAIESMPGRGSRTDLRA